MSFEDDVTMKQVLLVRRLLTGYLLSGEHSAGACWSVQDVTPSAMFAVSEDRGKKQNQRRGLSRSEEAGRKRCDP